MNAISRVSWIKDERAVTDPILLERDGHVATITLNRPEAGNALNVDMTRALMEAAVDCEADDGVRAVVLTGAGKLYCGGGDVKGFTEAGDQLPVFLRQTTIYVHAAILRLMRMPKPVVTAINGAAAGAGVGLALLGDIALIDPRASFTLAYTGIGLAPDGGATWMLPRLVGQRRAQEMCLRNRRVGAAEAAEIGMVTALTAEGKVVEEATALAHELAKGATGSLGLTKRLLLESASNSLEAHLDLESTAITSRGRSAEGREGIGAFLQKRPPDFIGKV